MSRVQIGSGVGEGGGEKNGVGIHFNCVIRGNVELLCEHSTMKRAVCSFLVYGVAHAKSGRLNVSISSIADIAC